MAELVRHGVTLHYEVWGDSGSWVTLINGHTRPLNDFRLMGRFLVERGFRVLAMDNRGAGKTVATGDFTFADMIDDVVALWDQEQIDVTDLGGISMGGFLAETLAAEHGERVRRLVLISTAMNQTHIRRDDAPWVADLDAVTKKMSVYFTADFASRNEVLVKSMMKQIVKAIETSSFAADSERQKRAVRGFDGAPLMKLIKAPTLVIHGDQDQIIPLAAGEELAAAIPGARLETLRGAGHLLLAERPKELYGLVEGWLSR